MPNEEKIKGVAGAVSAVAEAIARGEGTPKPPAPEGPPDVTAELSIIEKAKEFGKKVAQNIVQAENDLVKEGAHTARDLAVVLKNPDVIELTKGITSEAVDQNPHLAAFLSDVAHASENLKSNPYFWLQEATRLRVWSMRSDLPNEVHADTSAVLRKVGVKIAELSQSHPDFDVPNWAVQHGISEVARMSMVPVPDQSVKLDLIAQIIGESEDEMITDPRVVDKLKRAKAKLETDTSSIRHDSHKISNWIDELGDLAYEDPSLRDQIKEAKHRLQAVIDRSEESKMRNQFVRWSEVKGNVSKGIEHDDNAVFDQFRYFSPDEVELLKKGDEGIDEWAHRFLNKIYGFGKERSQPSLDESTQWSEFEKYVQWLYGKDSAVVQTYSTLWAEFGRHQAIITGLLYQPGDAKDKTRWFRLLTGNDLELYVRGFDYANYAMPLYEQAVMDLLNNRRAEYQGNITWLKGIESITNEKGETISIPRDKALEILKARNAKGQLSTGEQVLMSQIGDRLDMVREGAMLWDSDIINYTEMGIELQAMDRRRLSLKSKIEKNEPLTDAERQEYDRLEEEVPMRWKKYTQVKNEKSTVNELDNIFSYSPVDREVAERLKTYLEERGEKVEDWKIKRAIWAARQAMIGSGHLIAISSFMAVRPALEYKPTGKEVMRSPAFEEFQRIFNPDLFMHRFSMGDKMGAKARAILKENLLKGKGYKAKDMDKWIKDQAGYYDEDTQVRRMRGYLNFAEHDVGIPFTEMLSEGFFAGGGSFDGSGWRLEKGVVDELRKLYLDLQQQGKLPEKAILDNQALGIRLLIAEGESDKEQKKEQKLHIFERMMERTPNKFLQLLGKQRDLVLELHHMTDADLQGLQRALSMAEMKLWDDRHLATQHIDLTSENGFNDHVAPYLQKLGIPEAQYVNYLGVLQDIKKVFTEKRVDTHGKLTDGKRAYLHKSLQEAWLEHKFPMTLQLSDFNWKDSNLHQLGLIAMDRRGRDVEGMAKARDAWISLTSEPAFLSPTDPVETIKKLKEYRDAINSYADANTAEKATQELLRVFLEFNRHRGLYKFDWIPGGTLLMKRLGEMEAEQLPILKWFPQWKKFLEHNDFLGKKIEKLPHSIAEAVSHSVRFVGEEGNAFEEKKIAEILATAQQLGLFNANPQFISELRRDFKATWGRRQLGILRNYWWVVLFATIALATFEATEEQQKGAGGGH